MIRYLTTHLWEILTSIGTISAAVVALFLWKYDKAARLHASFSFGAIDQYQPKLQISNIGGVPISIKSIEIRYVGETLVSICVTDDIHAQAEDYYLPLHATKSYSLKEYIQFKDINKRIPNNPKKAEKALSKSKKIVIKISDLREKKYRFVQKQSVGKMGEAIFGQDRSDNQP